MFDYYNIYNRKTKLYKKKKYQIYYFTYSKIHVLKITVFCSL